MARHTLSLRPRLRFAEWLALVIAISSSGHAFARPQASDLDLWGGIVGGRFYADEHYLCLGYSRRDAKAAVQAALGRNFDARRNRVGEQLTQLYGAEAVAQSSEIIPIGHKLTPEHCRKVRHIVDDIRSNLTTLEQRLKER